MAKILNIPPLVKTLLNYTLAALVIWFLISRGLHPVFAILLVIWRKAAFRIALCIGALYWLTTSIM